MIKDLNYLNFQDSIQSGITLVHYRAIWCNSCLSQEAVLSEIAKETKQELTIAKVDVNDNRVLAKEQKVHNIPTLILYKNGQEINRFSGIQSKEIIISAIEKNL